MVFSATRRKKTSREPSKNCKLVKRTKGMERLRRQMVDKNQIYVVNMDNFRSKIPILEKHYCRKIKLQRNSLSKNYMRFLWKNNS